MLEKDEGVEKISHMKIKATRCHQKKLTEIWMLWILQLLVHHSVAMFLQFNNIISFDQFFLSISLVFFVTTIKTWFLTISYINKDLQGGWTSGSSIWISGLMDLLFWKWIKGGSSPKGILFLKMWSTFSNSREL